MYEEVCALYGLLAKAHTYLPMPQQSIPKDAEATALIYGALQASARILRSAQGDERPGTGDSAAADR
jgi:hypothetical protein